MKKLDELNISQAPWRFADDGMGEYDIRCSGVSYGDDYEGEDIIATGVQKKDAPMFAAAPKLYAALCKAVSWLTYYGEDVIGIGPAAEISEVVKEAEAALAEAAGGR